MIKLTQNMRKNSNKYKFMLILYIPPPMNVLVYFELSLGKKRSEDEIVKIVYCERAQVVWVKAVKSAL